MGYFRERALKKVLGGIFWFGALAAEGLVALAFWWRPEHKHVWAIIAVCVFVIALIVEYGQRGRIG